MKTSRLWRQTRRNCSNCSWESRDLRSRSRGTLRSSMISSIAAKPARLQVSECSLLRTRALERLGVLSITWWTMTLMATRPLLKWARPSPAKESLYLWPPSSSAPTSTCTNASDSMVSSHRSRSGLSRGKASSKDLLRRSHRAAAPTSTTKETILLQVAKRSLIQSLRTRIWRLSEGEMSSRNPLQKIYLLKSLKHSLWTRRIPSIQTRVIMITLSMSRRICRNAQWQQPIQTLTRSRCRSRRKGSWPKRQVRTNSQLKRTMLTTT